MKIINMRWSGSGHFSRVWPAYMIRRSTLGSIYKQKGEVNKQPARTINLLGPAETPKKVGNDVDIDCLVV
jgi:hypothetical protein